MKSGNLNFLEPSGPLQACNGAALPLPDLFLGSFQSGGGHLSGCSFKTVLIFSYCLSCIFSVALPDGTMCPGVDSASESEYQGFLLG